MLGIIVNGLAIAFGGIGGAIFGHKLPDHLIAQLNNVFGVCALGMGISSVILWENMPAVILSLIVGTSIGLIIHLGDKIGKAAYSIQKMMPGSKDVDTEAAARISLLVTACVLFCCSGSGIYGSIDAGISGNITILLSKSILDFFTAMIFACNLGMITSLISVPQFLIFSLLFLLARVIYPLTTPMMINDFKACGGLVLIATGLRIAKIKEFPVGDMIPAMLIVMPISALWSTFIVPML